MKREEKMKRMGFFGGSFNPPTYAHINIAKASIEKLGLDKFFFVPVGNLYNKPDLIDEVYRYDMLKIACKNENNIFGDYEVFKIDKQGVHCYQTLEDAKNALKHSLLRFHSHGLPPAVIVKCVIPRGTRYWANKEVLERYERTDNKYAELASERLKVCIKDKLYS